MSESSGSTAAAAAGAARRGTARLVASWRRLSAEQRLAAIAAFALFVSMFLPWYQKSIVGVNKGAPVQASQSLSAFEVFTFVEAAVLLVAAGVLGLLFARGENRAFHLPGGDGTIIAGGGLWVCLLVLYRQFDKPDGGKVAGLATTVGVEWGIFFTFIAGLFLAYTGQRLRAAHMTEPPLPGDVAPSDTATPGLPEPPRRRPRAPASTAVTRIEPRPPSGETPPPGDGGEQLSFDEEA